MSIPTWKRGEIPTANNNPQAIYFQFPTEAEAHAIVAELGTEARLSSMKSDNKNLVVEITGSLKEKILQIAATNMTKEANNNITYTLQARSDGQGYELLEKDAAGTEKAIQVPEMLIDQYARQALQELRQALQELRLANLPGLLKITDQEWEDAKKFFDENPDKTKMKKPPNRKQKHSFIKVGGEIFAIANKHCYQEQQSSLIGQGTFGKVKVVQNRAGENFAVKIEARGLRGHEDAETRIMQAISFSKGEAVRNIPEKFYKTEFTTQKLYTVMKLREGKELENHLYFPEGRLKKNELNDTQKLIVALKACRTVQELHDKNIIHADLKPANIMAKIDGTQIIVSSIDFGFSMILKGGEEKIITTPAGSPLYMAPELNGPRFPNLTWGEKGTFSFKSDIYALGVMFRDDLNLPPAIWKNMLEPDPAKRADMLKVMNQVIKVLEKRPDLDPSVVTMVKEIKIEIAQRKKLAKKSASPPPTKTPFTSIESILSHYGQETLQAKYKQLSQKNTTALKGMFVQFSKLTSHAIGNKGKERERQLSEIGTLFSALQNENISNEEKVTIASAFLQNLKEKITTSEKNVFSSGLAKLCDDLLQDIKGVANMVDIRGEQEKTALLEKANDLIKAASSPPAEKPKGSPPKA